MRNWVDIPISGQLFKEWLMDGFIIFARCKGGLPEGAEFVRSWHEVRKDIVHLVYEHPSFPETPEGGMTTMITPSYEDLMYKTLSELIYPEDD